MKVELVGKNLVITIPAELKNPKESSTGKTLLVATSGGNKETDIEVNGKKVKVGITAFINKK